MTYRLSLQATYKQNTTKLQISNTCIYFSIYDNSPNSPLPHSPGVFLTVDFQQGISLRQTFINFKACAQIDFKNTLDCKMVEVYTYSSVIRGQKIQIETWTPHINEETIAGCEEGNINDRHAVVACYVGIGISIPAIALVTGNWPSIISY